MGLLILINAVYDDKLSFAGEIIGKNPLIGMENFFPLQKKRKS